MRLELDPGIIEKLKRSRLERFLPLPDRFYRKTLFKKGRMYGLETSSTVEGTASFENRPVAIRLSPMQSALPRFSSQDHSMSLDPGHCIRGAHNIQLGEIKIIEHIISLMSAMNLRFDVSLTEPSFPTFNECNLPFLRAIEDNVKDIGPAAFFTVKKPFGLLFEKGYVLLEPDDGSRNLRVDHQIEYPGRSIGKQRIEAVISPEFYSFLCSARTPSFRSAEETAKNVELLKSGVKIDYPVSLDNVLFVDPGKIHNPRSVFVEGKVNYEFMMHELIDITAWLMFVELKFRGKFAGKMTTLFFDHHAQIDAAQFVCGEEFSRIGMTALS